MTIDKKELWIQLVRDAQAKYEVPDDFDGVDDVVDDMVDVATKYADSILDELESRESDGSFGKGRRSGRGGGRRKRKPQDEEPDRD